MTAGAIFWLVVFCTSVLLFFVVATVIAIHGVGDLRRLLKGSRGKEDAQQR